MKATLLVPDAGMSLPCCALPCLASSSFFLLSLAQQWLQEQLHTRLAGASQAAAMQVEGRDCYSVACVKMKQACLQC